MCIFRCIKILKLLHVLVHNIAIFPVLPSINSTQFPMKHYKGIFVMEFFSYILFFFKHICNNNHLTSQTWLCLTIVIVVVPFRFSHLPHLY